MLKTFLRRCNKKPNTRPQKRIRRRPLIVEPLESRLVLSLTVPAFSSLPGADHTIYLDFDGETVQSTSWNSYYNQGTLVAQAYDIDGDSSTFNSTELARIEEAWKRTAEDFRPFNVNVTTVDPGIEPLRNSGGGDTQWGVRAIVTKESTMVTDPNERCGCGGIAYINSFNWTTDTPVWVYTSGGKSIAEAASHEVGHSLGLSHDGLNSGTTYYSGHGSGDTGWAPIMGVGYYENVTQWDKGEYYNSNNGGSGANYNKGPDDLSIITTYNGFSYRADDHGDSNGAASPLGLSGTTVNDGGVVETTSDVDVFQFTTGAGLVTLNIDPFTPGPNLDIKADLYNSAGGLIASSNSNSVLDAGFSLNLAAGQYYLHVDGTGWGSPGANPPSGYSDYASLGQYTITGSIVDPGGLPSVSIADASADEDAGTMTFTLTLSAAAATNTSVAWSTANGSAIAGEDFVGSSGTATFTARAMSTTLTVDLIDDTSYEGNELLYINLSNPSGILIGDGQASGTILENDPVPLPTVSISDGSVAEGKAFTKGKNAGTSQLTDMTFTVTLSSASTQTITVNYSTSDDGTATAATAGTDYQSASSTVTFLAGETSKTVTVTVIGDNTQEGNETFNVDLNGPTNATISDGSAVGTIVDDDSGGGGGNGGGGNGGGKGNGKPKKSASELNPIAIADPIWFFEGPDVDHDHGEDSHFLPEADQAEEPLSADLLTAYAGLLFSTHNLGSVPQVEVRSVAVLQVEDDISVRSASRVAFFDSTAQSHITEDWLTVDPPTDTDAENLAKLLECGAPADLLAQEFESIKLSLS